MPQLSQNQILTHHSSNSINNKFCCAKIYNSEDVKNNLLTGHFVNEFTHVLKSEDRAANGELFIPLDSNVCTPSGSLGLNQASVG